jgi:hypothetical protein
MTSISSRTRIAMFGALAALAVLVAASSAAASTGTSAPSLPTLNGDWAPFNRCPVQSPAMKAADGVNQIALCLASDSPSGIFKGGNIPVVTGETNLQIGVVADNTTGTFTPIQPVGGAVVAAPVHTPGGFLLLACPSSTPPLSNACDSAARDPSLNDVQAIVQDAGDPSNLNVLAGAGVGQLIITLPIKIQLVSPLLGGNCYIGSDDDPIVLNLENTTAPTFSIESFDADGTPNPSGVMGRFFLPGATQGDSSFAVPAATGCGPGGTADATINSRLGLPSPSGNNSIVLNDATSFLTGFNDPSTVAPRDGIELAANWHLAMLP